MMVSDQTHFVRVAVGQAVEEADVTADTGDDLI